MSYSISEIIKVLEKSWTAETSFNQSEWVESNPARGHCVVSVLILQDIFGGEIKRYEVTGKNIQEKHFVNIIEGTEIDSTRSQYETGVTFKEAAPKFKTFKSIREKLLADNDTKLRYEKLKKRVLAKI